MQERTGTSMNRLIEFALNGPLMVKISILIICSLLLPVLIL